MDILVLILYVNFNIFRGSNTETLSVKWCRRGTSESTIPRGTTPKQNPLRRPLFSGSCLCCVCIQRMAMFTVQLV